MKTLCALCVAAFSLAAQTIPGATGADWPSYGGTHAAWRYSSLDQINTANVAKLSAVWAFQTGDAEHGLQSTPIVIDGILYLSTSNNWVFALDAATGWVLWEYRYAFAGSMPAANRTAVWPSVTDWSLWAPPTITSSRSRENRRESWRVNVRGFQAMRLQHHRRSPGGEGQSIRRRHRRRHRAPRLPYHFDAHTGRFAWRFYVIPSPGEKVKPGPATPGSGRRRALDDRLLRSAESCLLGHRQCFLRRHATKRRGDNLSPSISPGRRHGELRGIIKSRRTPGITMSLQSSSRSRNQGAVRKVLNPSRLAAWCSTAPPANSHGVEFVSIQIGFPA